MLTPQSMPQSILPDVKALFNLGRESADPAWRNWNEVTTSMQSNSETEEMVALGAVTTFKKWEDERQVTGFPEYKYRVKNYPWEHTIGIDRRLVQFDKTGQIEMRCKSAGYAFESWLSEKIWKTFRAGSSLVCYDGQYFFDTDHAWTGSNQSNLSTGNSPLTAVNLDAAMAAMRVFSDANGRPLGVNPDLLIVGPQNARAAWELTQSRTSNLATYNMDNYYKGVLRYIEVPWIYGNSTGNEWYLVDTKKVAKPIIHTYVTANPEITEQGRDSYPGFNRREYQYGAYYDAGFGVGDWFIALKNGIADPALATGDNPITPADYYAG